MNAEAPTAKPQITRLPLLQIWLADSQDFPGGHAIQSSLLFGKPKIKGRQYFMGWFVPSYQVVEIEWYANEDAKPDRLGVPMASVKKYKLA